jgi:cytochrome P450
MLDFLLEEMNKILENGGSVMKLWVGPKLIVLPLDSESTKAITSSTSELNKGTDYVFFQQWLGKGLLLGPGDQHWFKIRRMVTPAFHFAKIEEYTEIMDDHSRVNLNVPFFIH